MDKIETGRLTNEARNCAVLDSGCSSTVAGKLWMDCYLESLPKDDISKVIKEKSSKTFKFGGGEVKTSTETITFPCTLAGTRCQIKSDIVDSDIPLLLSKTAMKQAQIKMNLINATAKIFGNNVDLLCTSSGHYCLPLNEPQLIVEQIYFTISENSISEKRKLLRKIQSQFAHPTKSKLVKLMKDANVWDNDFDIEANELYENCDICKKFRKTPPQMNLTMLLLLI